MIVPVKPLGGLMLLGLLLAATAAKIEIIWLQAAAVAIVSEWYNNVSMIDLCVYSSLVSAALHVLTN